MANGVTYQTAQIDDISNTVWWLVDPRHLIVAQLWDSYTVHGANQRVTQRDCVTGHLTPEPWSLGPGLLASCRVVI